eukprot:SAG31_NODE_902_length_11133_cov_4.169386_6_plen_78_part_00
MSSGVPHFNAGRPQAVDGVEVVPVADPAYAWTRQLRGTIWEDFGGDLVAAERQLAEEGGALFRTRGLGQRIFSRSIS